MLHYVPHSVLYTALPIGDRRSCFVCRRTPGPALPFGFEAEQEQEVEEEALIAV